MYPFITSYSDLPIFFSKPSIEIELEGSKGLRYRVPQSVSSVRLGVGQLVLQPKLQHKAGFVTDLVWLRRGPSGWLFIRY